MSSYLNIDVLSSGMQGSSLQYYLRYNIILNMDMGGLYVWTIHFDE